MERRNAGVRGLRRQRWVRRQESWNGGTDGKIGEDKNQRSKRCVGRGQ